VHRRSALRPLMSRASATISGSLTSGPCWCCPAPSRRSVPAPSRRSVPAPLRRSVSPLAAGPPGAGAARLCRPVQAVRPGTGRRRAWSSRSRPAPATPQAGWCSQNTKRPISDRFARFAVERAPNFIPCHAHAGTNLAVLTARYGAPSPETARLLFQEHQAAGRGYGRTARPEAVDGRRGYSAPQNANLAGLVGAVSGRASAICAATSVARDETRPTGAEPAASTPFPGPKRTI